MSDSRRPSLFDLPLDPPNSSDASSDSSSEGFEPPGESAAPTAADTPGERPPATPTARGPRRAAGDPLPLFPDSDGDDAEAETGPAPRRPEPPRSSEETRRPPAPASATDPEPAPPRKPTPAGPRPAPLGARFQAGLLDLLIHLGLALAALAVGLMVGVPWRPRELGGLALFLLVFSFLYTVIPLAFWGRTPGMARIGVVARSRETGALTFGQTAQRWLGGVLSVLLVGLPVLLALVGGRSLADRLSGSRLWLDPP